MKGTGRSITVSGTIYHRAGPHAQATAINLRWSRELVSDEQPWGPRQIKVTEEWQPLDCGWLKPELCGMIVLENLEGKFLQTIPTEEQRSETASKVIEVGFDAFDTVRSAIDNKGLSSFARVCQAFVVPLLTIHPKETQPLSPVDVSSLRIRCRKGTAKCVLTVLPK